MRASCPVARAIVIVRSPQASRRTRALFGVPGGGGNLDLIEAAGRAGLPFVLTATETGGALAAMAQAEVTGRARRVPDDAWPGAASVANGVACAFLDRAPLLVFTDSHAAAAAARSSISSSTSTALFAPITKWSGRLSPEARDAIARARIRRPCSTATRPRAPDCPGTMRDPRETSRPGRRSDRRPDTAADASPRDGNLQSPDLADLLSRRAQAAGHRRPRARAAAKMPLRSAVSRAPRRARDGHLQGQGRRPGRSSVLRRRVHARAHRAAARRRKRPIIGIGLDPVELLPRPWNYPQPIVYVGRWRVAETHMFHLPRSR